jgi:hypothetical protein
MFARITQETPKHQRRDSPLQLRQGGEPKSHRQRISKATPHRRVQRIQVKVLSSDVIHFLLLLSSAFLSRGSEDPVQQLLPELALPRPQSFCSWAVRVLTAFGVNDAVIEAVRAALRGTNPSHPF